VFGKDFKQKDSCMDLTAKCPPHMVWSHYAGTKMVNSMENSCLITFLNRTVINKYIRMEDLMVDLLIMI